MTEDLGVGGAPSGVQKVEGGRNLARGPLLAASSGGLLVLAFPRADLGPVAFVALVPLLIAIRGATWRAVGGLGFVAGFAFFLVSLYWLAPTIVRYGGLTWAAALGILLLLAGYLALYVAGFAAGVAILGQRGAAFVLSAAALWVALELVRAHLLTGFPWNLLGHSQYRNLPLIQVAAVTGVYGVSFAVAAVNAAIADILAPPHAWRRAVPSAATAALLVGAALAYGWVAPPDVSPPTVRIAVLQGNIPQAVKWDPAFQDETLRIYRDLTLAQANRRPGLVVWPEAAIPFFLRRDPRRAAIEGLAAEVGAPLLVGAPDAEGSPPVRYTNSAFLITPGGGIAGKYDKIHLVPFGEYVPLKPLLSFVNKLAQGAIGDFAPGREYPVFAVPAGRFGVVISYEVYFPGLVRRYFRAGADFLVNITNDAWYGRSAAPYQHLAMAVFRAVENRAYLIRAANTGISAVIAPDGRIMAASSLFEQTALRGEVAPRSGETLYTRYGDVFAWGAAAAVGVALLGVAAGRVRVVLAPAAQRIARARTGEAGMTGFAERIRRWAAPTGSGASALSASFAAGCVGLLAPLATVITALGLDWLHLASIQMPILYGTTALALGSLLLSANRHRRPWPPLLGLLGVAGILYPFHEALDVTVFGTLVYGGSGTLLLAAAWDFILCRRARCAEARSA